MTITFPRALPDIVFLPARFTLNRSVAAAQAGAGFSNHTETFDPVWTIDLTSKPLRESDLATLTAWWTSLKDGLKSALVTQNVTCRPKAHAAPANAAPAQDAGVLGSVSNGNSVAVTGVSSSLVLAPGDLIGIEENGGHYGLGRVLEASGSGTSRTIVVDPPPRAYVVEAGAVIRFENPKLIMRPVPRSWKADGGSMVSVSFSLAEAKS